MKFQNTEIETILANRTDATDEDQRGGCDVVYALFQESRESPDPNWSRGERWLQTAIQLCQPAPAMAHVELLLPPVPDTEGGRTQFATYLGRHANWQTNQLSNYAYYLVDHAVQWRAVPIFAPRAAERVRTEADSEVGVEYSLMRYVTSTRAFRALAWLLPSSQRTPAHCATLTTRILQNSLDATCAPEQAPAWYGPSTLFTELCNMAAFRSQAFVGESSEGMIESASRSVETLLRAPMTLETVQTLGDPACTEAIHALTMKTCSALQAGDDTATRVAQKQLATALLRWVILREVS